ncbi:creB Probable ubiquitin carboxyl-terminal hydrolase creB [Candida maltosa Xu316]
MDNSNGTRLPYGDGSYKIFGMENFGNTCYCNSILQCLYYTENFRTSLLQHHQTKHDPKLTVAGYKPHSFTTKYEQLVQKKLKEQGGKPSAVASLQDERPKVGSRKGSIFGIKFNNNNGNGNNNANGNNNSTASSTTVITVTPSNDGKHAYNKYIKQAKNCDELSLEQRIKINKSPEFKKLDILITRPLSNQIEKKPAEDERNDFSQSSSMLLTDQPQSTPQEGSISTTSSAIVVGIPHPETILAQPINPFNANPSGDQRKRSALINGPIINLDIPLKPPSELNDDTVLLYALKDLFEKKNFLFRQNNMHHDAHEFFNYLVNEIIESINKEDKSEGRNWCSDIFRGLITNETKCLSCENVTSQQELFLDLSVDIPPGESAFSLSYALNNFSKSETLTNQNKFYCNTCSSLQEAVKTIKVKKLPEVLVINLKRFKYDEKMDKLVKLFDSISYPSKLRLFNTTDDESLEDKLYDLYALVIHIGGGPMHGHYVSICKIKAGLWLLFDDETVELVEDSYVMRFFGDGPGLASAYILFYKQSDCNAEYGFNPDDLYNGNDDYSLKHHEDENSTLATSVANDYLESKSEASSIASYNVAEASKKGSGMFRSFKFEKDDKDKDRLSAHSLSRSSSINAPTASPQTAVPQSVAQPNTTTASTKEVKEKKSWVGNLKRRKDDSTSSGNSSSAPTIERKASSSSATSGSERRRSIFGFRKK